MEIRKISLNFVLSLIFFVAALSSMAEAKRLPIEEETSHPARKVSSNGNEMRHMRRMGVSLIGAGALGIGGMGLELNFSPNSGLFLGFGGGTGFQAVAIQYKQVLAGEWMLPYMGVGLAKWQNFGEKGPITDTTPGILSERLLSDDAKRSGRINETLFYPSFGLQYIQLDGDWAGFSVFAEILVLVDLGNFVAGPTGSVGVGYYF